MVNNLSFSNVIRLFFFLYVLEIYLTLITPLPYYNKSLYIINVLITSVNCQIALIYLKMQSIILRIEDLGLIFFINLFPPLPLSFIPLFSSIFSIHLLIILIIKDDIFTNKFYIWLASKIMILDKKV